MTRIGRHDPITRTAPEGWRQFDAAVANWLLGLAKEDEVASAALVALVAGADSPSLLAVGAILHGGDRAGLLALVFATYVERGLEFPLRDDAIDRSLADLLRSMLAGAVTPEDASAKFWNLADKQYEEPDREYLDAFKSLAISLTLFEDQDCDFALDLVEWRAEMLSLARAAVDGISLEEHDQRQHQTGERNGA
jgi:hypothetical protein